ncbi:Cys-rich peptide radical SAM maturase CcpM [Anaeromicropila populeti]|uniref:Radical SAM core domain-containing protein n=1 Tax=Anaeromicropila populeti TaxID=37658 RepID=A0A1I6ID59_9FIRM|nr:Cys-rich peptide radical SAM maturase CcpM [Anaeromicropila populeti]SFR64707.1 uncharacterized protein SAMN05661086_00721 [Anaeromicropila populeti]
MIVYKLLKTPDNYYVYDRNKNKILNISEADYLELSMLKKNEISESEVSCLKKFQKNGYLQENIVEEIQHPETKYINHFLNNRVRMLILQVTQSCNLRCEYCSFSGNYENRVHSNKFMTWETAKKAIDYLYEHSSEMDEVTVSFYGGEPLLCLDFIKKCVLYIKETYADRKTSFGMTTNGTLLSLEAAEFLFINNFSVTISLDGSKKDHDANRKFADGRGSFDIIMENIKRIAEHNKDFIDKVRFNTVLNTKSDYGTVRNYFLSEDIVCDASIGIGLVESINSKEDIVFADKFVNQRRYDFFLLLISLLKKANGVSLPGFVKELKSGFDLDYSSIEDNRYLSKSCHHSGPCIPGATRMFVNTDGGIYSCEKVSEYSEVMRIGEIETGIDVQKVSEAMNIGSISEKDCKNCWALNWCSMCALYVEKNGQFDAATKKANCAQAILGAEDKLLNLCVLKEFGYKFGKEELYV